MDQWTIALLGDSRVGKTTLATMFTLNCIPGVYPLEQGPFRKQLVVDNRMCFVEVLDAEVLEDHSSAMREELMRNGQGFILIYSVTSRSSFDKIAAFHQTLVRARKMLPPFILIGNRADAHSACEVSKEEGAALARELGCEFLETSAKTAQNVERTFITLIRALRRRKAEEAELAVAPQPSKRTVVPHKCVVM
ncbi:P-loop containing nucleoside triphosphate hydrolase protein [Favolaschia claudopus]|uniref:P-loop containing nucleoside triphosphate hydrolase protein n=1 Tax=Favolaschia claudopus TaxID=2862362 RepID=A0AAW0CML2_9AGAR